MEDILAASELAGASGSEHAHHFDGSPPVSYQARPDSTTHAQPSHRAHRVSCLKAGALLFVFVMPLP